MFVSERMSHPVITVSPDLSIVEALKILKQEHIRRAPVVKNGKLVGIVSDKDLLNASSSPATTLSIWELNYLLDKIKVHDVMTKEVLTVTGNTPIETAARIMADNKVGGLPVMRDSKLVGIITETDLFKVFLELFGAREKGVRITLEVLDKPGELARITPAIAELRGNIIASNSYAGEDALHRNLTLKIVGPTEEEIQSALQPLVERIFDIRTC
jgi:acetoin utilization protein AcuB